jgi:signal transduction histidine kinase
MRTSWTGAPAQTAKLTSRAAIFGTTLVLLFFSFLLLYVLVAMNDIDARYEAEEARIDRTVRSLLRGETGGEDFAADMDALLAFTEKLGRVSLWADPGPSAFGLDRLRRDWASLRAGDASSRLPLVSSLEYSEKGIGHYRLALKRAFHALLGALVAGLALSLILGAFLWLRLRESRKEAYWSQMGLHRALAAEEETRKRIARDLHDEAAQDVAAARMLCERAASSTELSVAVARAAEASAALSSAGRRIRYIATELRPPGLDEAGLCGALETLCARTRDLTGREVSFRRAASLPSVTGSAAIHAYRIAQEALANARKHAPGNRIEVAVGAEEGQGRRGLLIRIRDSPAEGRTGAETRGAAVFDPSLSSGLGMAIMMERASIFGGELRFEAEAGGFAVSLFIPVAKEGTGHV